jgi:hypothetical protein
MRMKFLFTLLRTLSVSPEIAKELMKLKTIEDILEKMLPVCKNEKDIKLMRNYLSNFSAFIAAYSTSEDGHKILLVSRKFIDIEFRNLKSSMSFPCLSWTLLHPSTNQWLLLRTLH